MNTQSQGQMFIQALEKNIRSILSIGAITYAWGFVVASIYLSQYHVVSLNLLRIQYILAGIWIVVPIIIFSVALFWFAASIYYEFFDDRIKETDKGIKRLRRMLGGLVYVLISTMGCYVITSRFLNWSAPNVFAQFTPLTVSESLKSIVFCFGIALSIGLSWLISKTIRDKSSNVDIKLIMSAIFSYILTGLMVMGYTFYFATSIYPKIPSVFGGGQPIEVRFILAHDSNYESSREALHFADGEELSPTVKLVTTTEADYIIIDPTDSRRVILLPQKSVSLFIFESK